MANHTGKDGVVSIGGNTVAEFNAWSIDESANVIDDTNLTDTADTHQAGTTNWSASIECYWDETDTTGQGAMTIGASVSVVFLPEGETSGDVSRTGTATITGKSQGSSLNSMVTQTFSLQGNGALVDGTVA